jgi:hypothetical protein
MLGKRPTRPSEWDGQGVRADEDGCTRLDELGASERKHHVINKLWYSRLVLLRSFVADNGFLPRYDRKAANEQERELYYFVAKNINFYKYYIGGR